MSAACTQSLNISHAAASAVKVTRQVLYNAQSRVAMQLQWSDAACSLQLQDQRLLSMFSFAILAKVRALRASKLKHTCKHACVS